MTIVYIVSLRYQPPNRLELYRAFMHFRVRPEITRHFLPLSHEWPPCALKCPFMQWGHIFVCLQHGSVHHCGGADCDIAYRPESGETVGEWTCWVSGRVVDRPSLVGNVHDGRFVRTLTKAFMQRARPDIACTSPTPTQAAARSNARARSQFTQVLRTLTGGRYNVRTKPTDVVVRTPTGHVDLLRTLEAFVAVPRRSDDTDRHFARWFGIWNRMSSDDLVTNKEMLAHIVSYMYLAAQAPKAHGRRLLTHDSRLEELLVPYSKCNVPGVKRRACTKMQSRLRQFLASSNYLEEDKRSDARLSQRSTGKRYVLATGARILN